MYALAEFFRHFHVSHPHASPAEQRAARMRAATGITRSNSKPTWPVSETKCFLCGKFGKRDGTSLIYWCYGCMVHWRVPHVEGRDCKTPPDEQCPSCRSEKTMYPCDGLSVYFGYPHPDPATMMSSPA